MNWVLFGAIAFALWSALRVLGNERQRRLDEQTALDAAALTALSAPPTDAVAPAH